MSDDATTLPRTRDTIRTMNITPAIPNSNSPENRGNDSNGGGTSPKTIATARRAARMSGVFALGILAVAAGLVGCKGTLGTDTANISGSVLSGGKIIGGSLTINSNTISLGGTVAQGSTTNGGAISIGY